MRAITISTLTLLFGINPALAADVDVGELNDTTQASWSGFYTGGSIGHSNVEDSDPTIITGVDVVSIGDGSTFGFHMGYMENYNGFVFGGEYEYVDNGSIQFVAGAPINSPLPVFVEDNHNLRVRAGFASDNVHIFGSGGMSFVRAINTVTNVPLEDWVFTVGAGIEYAASDNIIVGIQYDYSWYDEFATLPIKGSMDRISMRVSYKF